MAQHSHKRPIRERAVALKYDADGDAAPRVTAKGSGALARKILELARDGQVPVRSDPDLLELLSSIDVMEEIPPDLYEVVAEVLAFVYNVNEKQAGSGMPGPQLEDSTASMLERVADRVDINQGTQASAPEDEDSEDAVRHDSRGPADNSRSKSAERPSDHRQV